MQIDRFLIRKLLKSRIWRRILLERLTEPIHLNLVSLFVLAFGTYRTKIAWDLVVRQPYAYGILKAAELARQHGLDAVTVVEFGVAAGGGLLNMAHIAARVQRETGVALHIHGFDTGSGMPPAVDYRDHPELYQEGDFEMDQVALEAILPPNVTLHIGPLPQRVAEFLDTLGPAAPLGFVSLDVDYYSSTVDALTAFAGPAEKYLPWLVVYVDDISLEPHNSKAGQLCAITEFNDRVPIRQLERHAFFEQWRIFRRASWIRHIMFLHVLDHERRSTPCPRPIKRYIENPYLPHEAQRERFSIEPG